MPLLVKDATTATQSLSTQADAAGALVPMHVPGTVSGGIIVPASAAAPLPVVNTAGAVASDGSGVVASGGTAQPLFGGITPANGYLVANLNASGGRTLYISDVGTASAAGSSIPVPPQTVYQTPSGYKPPGAVSLFGTTTGDAFAARRW